jgi:hypothetical protein
MNYLLLAGLALFSSACGALLVTILSAIRTELANRQDDSNSGKGTYE